MIDMKELMDHFGVKGQTHEPVMVWHVPTEPYTCNYSKKYSDGRMEPNVVQGTYICGIKKRTRYGQTTIAILMTNADDIELLGIEGAQMVARDHDVKILANCFKTKVMAQKMLRAMRILAAARYHREAVVKIKITTVDMKYWQSEIVRAKAMR